MKRLLSVGFAAAGLVTILSAAACGGDEGIIPIGPGEGGGSGSDTGRDREVPVSLDDPPAGQGATNTFKYNEGVVVADAAFVNAVVVDDNTLTVPTAGQEGILGQLQADVVFSGDRAANMNENNPLGFLRRVTGVRADGALTVIDTLPASLDDLFAEADFGGGGDPAADGTQELGSGLDLLDTGSAGRSFGLNVNLGELTASGGSNKLKVSGAFGLTVQPRVFFRYEKRFLRVPNVEVDVQVAVRRLFGACLKAEIKGGGVSVTEKAKAKTFPLGTIRFPIPVPPPMVVTAKFQSEATCSFEPSGAFGFGTQIENNSNLRVRFGVQDGETFRGADWPDTPNTVRFEAMLQGGIKAECKASIKGGIYMYDRVGGFAEFAPGVTASAAGYGKYTQGEGARGQICAGVEGKFQINAGLEADVWVAKYERKWELWKKTFPIPGLPTPKCVGTRRAADGCDGRQDGTYCSAQNGGSAYKCRGGVTAGGLSCPTGQFCKPDADGKAALEGEGLKCETSEPAEKPMTLSFCPGGNPG